MHATFYAVCGSELHKVVVCCKAKVTDDDDDDFHDQVTMMVMAINVMHTFMHYIQVI